LSLEEVNHVKSIGQKYKSNRALGNFDRSPNPRTHSAVYILLPAYFCSLNPRLLIFVVIDTFGLDNIIKSKPVLGVDDLLLLLNYY
jgi:hypothetical protein